MAGKESPIVLLGAFASLPKTKKVVGKLGKGLNFLTNQ